MGYWILKKYFIFITQVIEKIDILCHVRVKDVKLGSLHIVQKEQTATLDFITAIPDVPIISGISNKSKNENTEPVLPTGDPSRKQQPHSTPLTDHIEIIESFDSELMEMWS